MEREWETGKYILYTPSELLYKMEGEPPRYKTSKGPPKNGGAPHIL